MEEISPLFAIQAEKALQMNNPQLAIEICKRGLQFFPDYQIGYVLMAEAYEMMGENSERDKLVEQIHQRFPKAITTKAIDEKIKAEGSLLSVNDEVVLEDIYSEEIENISNEEDFITETETENIYDKKQTDTDNDEIVNIDELIDEAQSVIEDIEETIQDLEDEIANAENKYVEYMVETDENDESDEVIIQEYAELESEVADFQDFANSNESPEAIVVLSEELLEFEKEHMPFEAHEDLYPSLDFQIDNFSDIDLIKGINFLPFKFNYEEIIELSKNISIAEYQIFENEQQNTIPEIVEDTIANANDNEQTDSTYQTEVHLDDSNKPDDNSDDDISDDFVPTETLAMIYEKQGKYMNAIDIYQKLMEIHPEKMEHYLNKIMLLETDGN